MTIRSELVTCGKPNCKKLHGEYLYNYYYENKRLRKKYIGKGTIEEYNKALEYQNSLKLTIDIKEILTIIRKNWLSKTRLYAKLKGFNDMTNAEAIVNVTQEMSRKYLDYNNDKILDNFLNSQVLTAVNIKPKTLIFPEYRMSNI